MQVSYQSNFVQWTPLQMFVSQVGWCVGPFSPPPENCRKNFELVGKFCSLAVNKNCPRRKFEGSVTLPIPPAEKIIYIWISQIEYIYVLPSKVEK